MNTAPQMEMVAPTATIPNPTSAEFTAINPEVTAQAQPAWFLAAVTNDDIMAAIFGTEFDLAHPAVCSTEGDPTGVAWLARPWPCKTSEPHMNWYTAPATFRRHHTGSFRALKEQAEMVYCAMLDDIGTRVPLDRLDACPTSWLTETSPGNYQAGYILDQPVSATGGQADRLNKALIDAGLCDPGATGAATRWMRLPVAINGKRKYGNPSPRCRLAQWNPERRYSIAQMVDRLGLTLPVDDRPRVDTDQAPLATGGPVNWDEVRSALDHLGSDFDHPEWVAILMALQSTGHPEAYQIAFEWSAKGVKFTGERDVLKAWNSFNIKPGGRTIATLFDMAIKAGWQRPAPDVSGLFGPVSAPVVPPHPLAQFVTCNTQPVATRWIIPGFIGRGVVIFAGQHGVGKTTGLLPLAMVAAGLHASGDPLAPTHWRHVIYITEDVEQARRILTGIVLHGDLGIDANTVADRLHIVEARRLTPGYVVQVGATYREQFTRTVDGVEVLPLVVIDTKSAVLALEEENNNSEASAAMAALKQAFAGLPVWVVGHVAKSNMTRTDVEGLSMRGGSAFEADANQVLYLVKEGEVRYLVRGKTRFEARWSELQIEAHCADVVAVNEFGSMESVTLRWGIARPATKGRKEAAKQAQEREHRESALAVQREVLDAVQAAYEMGNPLNRAGVKTQVPRKREIVYSAIETLLNDFRLYEVVVPVEERTHHKRSAFLVRLTDAERDAAMKNGTVPVRVHTVPQTWSRLPNSSVPKNFTIATNM